MEYKISELAKLAGISPRTLRHYDKIGLLKAKRLKDSNYRIYTEDKVDMLQHILILKEMGFDLEHIGHMIKNIDESKRIMMLEDHLNHLDEKKKRIDSLIHTVSRTIKAMKGEIMMNDKDKFEGLKDKMIQDNDELYKDEVIETWGIDAYQKSKDAFKNFTEKEYEELNKIASNLIDTLKVLKDNPTDFKLQKEVYELHKAWLIKTWGGTYNTEVHFNLVDMYVSDLRFTKYYDQHGEGLAALLRDVVQQEIIKRTK